jgi:hypothetical protein
LNVGSRVHLIVEVQTCDMRYGFACGDTACVAGGVVGPGLSAFVDVGVEQNREGPGQLGADWVVLNIIIRRVHTRSGIKWGP